MTGSKHGVQCSDVNLWRRKSRAGVLKSGNQSLKTGKLFLYGVYQIIKVLFASYFFLKSLKRLEMSHVLTYLIIITNQILFCMLRKYHNSI